MHAGSFVATVLTHHRHEGRPAIGIFFAVIHFVYADPRESLAVGSTLVGRGHIVFHGAGHHAGPAAVAAVDVDSHAVPCRSNLFVRGSHTRTTLARAPAAQRSISAGEPDTCTTPGGMAASSVTPTRHLPNNVSKTACASSSSPHEGFSATRPGASRRFDSRYTFDSRGDPGISSWVRTTASGNSDSSAGRVSDATVVNRAAEGLMSGSSIQQPPALSAFQKLSALTSFSACDFASA